MNSIEKLKNLGYNIIDCNKIYVIFKKDNENECDYYLVFYYNDKTYEHFIDNGDSTSYVIDIELHKIICLFIEENNW